MPGFWAGLWHGSVRTVVCPHCGKAQGVARRPVPFEQACKECRRTFRVTEKGTEKPPRG